MKCHLKPLDQFLLILNYTRLQGSEQGINFKIIAAALSVWYPIFLICWLGERLSEQVWL
jgi:hypothetical protein